MSEFRGGASGPAPRLAGGIVTLDLTLRYRDGMPEFAPDATPEELVSAAATALEKINDLILEVAAAAYRARENWGERGLGDFARELGLSWRRTTELELTYRRMREYNITPLPTLKTRHYTEATRPGVPDPARQLRLAHDNGETVAAMQARIRREAEADTHARIPLAPTRPCEACLGTGRCPHCGEGSCGVCKGARREPIPQEVAG